MIGSSRLMMMLLKVVLSASTDMPDASSFYLMSMIVFPNVNNTIDSLLLPLLQDLDDLRSYDWGFHAYSHLLYDLEMHAGAVRISMVCHWRLM